MSEQLNRRLVIEGAVECGDTARCKVTQIEGVVVCRHEYLHGMPRIAILPPGSFEGKIHESIHMDILQAELLEKATIDRGGLIPDSSIELGDKCVDPISGFKGICTGLGTWLYQCTQVGIAPQKLQKGSGAPVEEVWFDEQRLEVVEKGIIAAESREEPPGGPCRSISGSRGASTSIKSNSSRQ